MGACYFSTIAQLVERMTVNHDVVGSRPAGGVWMGILFKRADLHDFSFGKPFRLTHCKRCVSRS